MSSEASPENGSNRTGGEETGCWARARQECNVWESADGKNFTKVGVMPGIDESGNDVQFSGDELGHINVNKQQYLGYYHGAFAGWSAALAPLTITGQSGVSKVNTASALVYATKGAINVTVMAQ